MFNDADDDIKVSVQTEFKTPYKLLIVVGTTGLEFCKIVYDLPLGILPSRLPFLYRFYYFIFHGLFFILLIFLVQGQGLGRRTILLASDTRS